MDTTTQTTPAPNVFLKHWRGQYGPARSLLLHTLLPLFLMVWCFGAWREHLVANYVALGEETANSIAATSCTLAFMAWGASALGDH